MTSVVPIAIAFFCLTSAAAHAADSPAASVPGGAVITTEELLAEAQRLPPQAQGQIFARPENVAQWAQNVLIQRELARRAEADGRQNDPRVAAALRAARERVLAEAAISRDEGATPDADALEKLARTQYNAAPEKFDVPEQIRASHILVDARSCEPEARARELLARVRAPGADFAALAKEHSQDPGSASRGGELGFFGRGRMTAAFEAAAFALKQPGDVSDVVKTEFGYHIIRLDERRPARRRTFEEVRESLMREVAESTLRSKRRQLTEDIGAKVEFNRDAIEALIAARRAQLRSN